VAVAKGCEHRQEVEPLPLCPSLIRRQGRSQEGVALEVARRRGRLGGRAQGRTAIKVERKRGPPSSTSCSTAWPTWRCSRRRRPAARPCSTSRSRHPTRSGQARLERERESRISVEIRTSHSGDKNEASEFF
jgi:hypothetical protein